MVKPMKKHQAEVQRANGAQNSQIISSINMDTWQVGWIIAAKNSGLN